MTALRHTGCDSALDPDFEKTVLQWYNESESDVDDNFAESDGEDKVEELSEHIDDTSSEDDEFEERPLQRDGILKGKNGFAWSSREPAKTRTPSRNIVVKVPGIKNARVVIREIDAWAILFTPTILNEIITHTNEEIERQGVKYQPGTKYVHPTDNVEINALLGLLYIAGARKDAHLSVQQMFSSQGPQIYRCIMPEIRFKFLLNCLRFDDKEKRNREDKFSPIRQIWEDFIENCTKSYSPHCYVTIDEQLLGFRGKCPFRVYIGSKPDKYGIKVVCMCDSRTYYMISAIPYIGKNTNPTNESVPMYLVKELSKSIHGTNRNITMDNWFTSVPLAKEMLSSKDLTIVGTIRHNKREIPPSFLPSKNKPVLTSEFAFSDKLTLVSFTPKRNQSVILISTMHADKNVNEVSKKPEIIEFYNSTKGGVDTFDQMAHNYTVFRKTRRWPLRYFYGMLDQAAINAFVLYNVSRNASKITRNKFLQSLGLQLAKPWMESRLSKKISGKLQSEIREVLGLTHISEEEQLGPAPKKLKYIYSTLYMSSFT
ncbi:piggyBac transposable element-derived protein 4-like [Onthophagus taurus]|uniref:piggyBac transposable element-derived protein 4-like n=1 Tax=Onthophagus taurus TaxID=166361 RepID=UPI0039BDF755